MRSSRATSSYIAGPTLLFLLLVASCGKDSGNGNPNADSSPLRESGAPRHEKAEDVGSAEVPRIFHEVLLQSLIEQLDQDVGPELGATMRSIADYELAALPKLSRVVRDPSQPQCKRENAFFVVNRIGHISHEVSELFVYVLTNDDFAQRRQDYIGFAVEANVRSPEVQNAIAAHVQDPSWSVRANALAASISLGFTYRLNEGDLVALMSDRSPEVRTNACLVVGKLSHPCPATLKELSWRMLYDRDDTVRRSARQSYVARKH